jgi:hypothetical protein
MEVNKPSVADLLVDPDKTFLIPPYQRGYSWTADRWQGLVQDIVTQATSSTSDKKHWLGIILTSRSDLELKKKSYRHNYYDLIDGQQRIMTLRIWLQAVLDHAEDNLIEISGEKLQFSEIICQETDAQQFKDVKKRDEWRKQWRTYKHEKSDSGLMHCYTYFRWILWLGEDALLQYEPDPLPKKSRSEQVICLPIEEQWKLELAKREAKTSQSDSEEVANWQTTQSGQISCDSLIKATLENLSLIELERQELLDEDPAEIFQALNGDREPLGQFDHVRNEIFTGIKESSKRKAYYDDTWKEYDLALSTSEITSSGSKASETFLYDFLISIGEKKRQKSISINRTARHFTRWVNTSTSKNYEDVASNYLLPSLVAWISVKRQGESFRVKGKTYELSSQVKQSLETMEALSSGPVVPVLMNLVDRFFKGEIVEDSLKRQMFMVESFVGRKVLSRVGLSSFRSEMMNFVSSLPYTFSEEELRKALSKIAPTDTDIEKAILPRENNKKWEYEDDAKIKRPKGLKPRQILAIFQAIENERSGKLSNNLLEGNAEENFTIEHIFPQDVKNWRDDLRRWNVGESFMDNRLHTLGNLAVIPKRLNSQLSNAAFSQKKSISKNPESRFPNLRINEYWLRDTLFKWTPVEIDDRAKQLLASALKHWTI